MPSAFPSKEMLKKYPFVRKAVEKPWYTYIRAFYTISPLHLIGLLFLVVLFIVWINNTRSNPRNNENEKVYNSNNNPQHLKNSIPRMVVFSSLPMGYLLLLTALGIIGSGYQLRFILPILPFTGLLSAIALQIMETRLSTIPILSSSYFPLVFSYISYSVILFFYYCNLYSIYYADLEYSLLDIIIQILQSAYPELLVNTDFVKLMTHFGVVP
jgi:hypothetical protein